MDHARFRPAPSSATGQENVSALGRAHKMFTVKNFTPGYFYISHKPSQELQPYDGSKQWGVWGGSLAILNLLRMLYANKLSRVATVFLKLSYLP